MLLQHCTWAEVETYLERSLGIIVPIGSTEQHGPNGLIGTDAMCAEAIAELSLAISSAISGLKSISVLKGVVTAPGQMILAVMPCRAHSAAAVRV